MPPAQEHGHWTCPIMSPAWEHGRRPLFHHVPCRGIWLLTPVLPCPLPRVMAFSSCPTMSLAWELGCWTCPTMTPAQEHSHRHLSHHVPCPGPWPSAPVPPCPLPRTWLLRAPFLSLLTSETSFGTGTMQRRSCQVGHAADHRLWGGRVGPGPAPQGPQVHPASAEANL